MPQVSIANVNAVVARLADEVSVAAAQAIARRGFFSIAMPGGSVATQCFPTLAQLPVSWSNVHFFWADERAVPASDPESNFGLADRLWLTPAGIPESSVHRMPADAPDLAEAADTYASELMRVLGGEAVLDLALLGWVLTDTLPRSFLLTPSSRSKTVWCRQCSTHPSRRRVA